MCMFTSCQLHICSFPLKGAPAIWHALVSQMFITISQDVLCLTRRLSLPSKAILGFVSFLFCWVSCATGLTWNYILRDGKHVQCLCLNCSMCMCIHMPPTSLAQRNTTHVLLSWPPGFFWHLLDTDSPSVLSSHGHGTVFLYQLDLFNIYTHIYMYV